MCPCYLWLCLFLILKLVTGSVFVNRLLYCVSVRPKCYTSIQVGVGCVFCVWEGVTERECECESVRGVKPKPLSLADGHGEDGLTQEQWGPLTKTTPPRHVASCHRGNPPWDRERADSWRGGLTKMESISFHWSSPTQYISPLLPVGLYSGPLWMSVTSHFTASCDWPYGLDSPPTAHPTPPGKKKSERDNNKSSLYGLLLLSVIREHWSHWQIWGWATRFHTHCTLDFTPHFKTDEHFLYRHKEA